LAAPQQSGRCGLKPAFSNGNVGATGELRIGDCGLNQSSKSAAGVMQRLPAGMAEIKYCKTIV